MSLIQESIKQWNDAPDILKHQIEVLSSYFCQSRRVEKDCNKIKQKYSSIKLDGKTYRGKELYDIFLYTCIFNRISALEASKTRFLKYLPCYNERGEPIIKLESLITSGTNVKLFSGRFICPENYPQWGDKPVVVKLYEGRDGKHTTAFEIDIYRYLSNPSPSLEINCYLWNIPVLIMKPMKELGPDDDYVEVGIQILKQLPAVHRFTVHSDIKPDNVMREEGIRPRQYRLIDFGGCARELLSDGRRSGFKRRTWSSKWTTQKRRAVVTTPKNDLLELGHTLTALKYIGRTGKSHYPGKSRRTFSGKLKRYMDYVESIDDSVIKHYEYAPHYLRLIDILNGGKESSQIVGGKK